MEEQEYDYLEPIEVAKGVYWIGYYDEKASFHSNPYLLIDGDEAVVFDPAGVMEYPKVASKIFSLVDPAQISYIILHHQDPDLCSGVPLLEDVITNKQLKIVTHSRAAVLINYYGVKSEIYAVDRHQYELALKSGRILKFMKTPFCHFPSAIVTYDPKEKLLFSSDIFAALSVDWGLFAGKGYERQMETFHVGYMASRKHLNIIMDKIAKMDLAMILPQHGSIIKGEMISRCIEFLKGLHCGIDSLLSEEELYGWIPK
ncbi:nitric oxide reductase [bacterium BMS3Abin10]|nr:nitric oxide reductase [bacterium BMS3Abin10]GBE38607.1 nitric oxide reductase [bacterium BMS3Bbin08]HDK17248.1 MBL fold metallo-hydrolase [Nitrospirota bacterium]